MIRRLMASSAIVALMTAGAWTAQAQDQPTDQPAAVQQDATGANQGAATGAQPLPADQGAAATTDQGAAPMDVAAEAEPTLTPDQPTIATAFIGQSVFSSEDPESDNIGEVNDLIIGDDGKITHAVIGVGGFLGIGEKDVAVPFDELAVVERDGDIRLVYAATKEQLEQAEAYDRTAYDPRARFQEEQAAQADATATGTGTGLTPAPATDVTAMPADQQAADQQAAATAEQPADQQPADQQAAATTEQPADQQPADQQAAATTEQPADQQSADQQAAMTAEQPADQQSTDQQAAATAEQPADQQQMAADQSATGAASTDAAAGTDQQQMAAGETGFLSFNADQIRASKIMGQEIYGGEGDESIGEVADLVLQDDGETRAAIVDVGGFLGVGEKRVAIPFNEIEVGQNPDNPDEPRLQVAWTKEQLEQAPAWEDQTMGSEQASADQQAAGQQAADATAVDPNAPAATDPNAPADQQQMAAGTDPNAPADQQQMAAGADPNAAAGAAGQFQTATQDVSADELIGAAVVSPEDETIGEVGDVLFTAEGQIEAVVVDVGGFLGIGEKPVAVQYDALNVQKNENGDMRLMVNATQDQLQNAPAYDENAAEGQQQPQ
ncbi:MAG TPA: PRC-barrel domain-containing protein [Propylenella sp.]|nr:PRC-barrel domain-containing protein [Propylenella sp.]